MNMSVYISPFCFCLSVQSKTRERVSIPWVPPSLPEEESWFFSPQKHTDSIGVLRILLLACILTKKTSKWVVHVVSMREYSWLIHLSGSRGCNENWKAKLKLISNKVRINPQWLSELRPLDKHSQISCTWVCFLDRFQHYALTAW